ncbi:MAG: 30S ribosomal protein S9 [Actinobacteria bacterium RBG_13_63_9]|nr:MAG: 30S ribosomal protein S9 [Actinobacteria bacterium RBG_13_63_9]
MTQEQQIGELAVPEGERYYYGTGRRKTAVARVRLYAGSGDIIVNDKPFQDVVTRLLHRVKVRQPLVTTETENRFNVRAKIVGGGVSAWADALAHGISRALVAFDPGLRPALRKAGLLTRDSRVKERKKPGLKRARKAPQYTKR